MNAAWMLWLWALTLPSGLSEDGGIEMSKGIALLGSEVPEEAALGQEIAIDLYFKVPGPLDHDTLNFLHMEVVGDEGKCRIVRDERPKTLEGAILHHQVKVKIPNDGSCKAGQDLLVYTGLYNNKTWDRVAVEGIATHDDRIFAGSITLVEGEAAADRQTFNGSDILRERFWTLIKPWWGWIGWIALSLAMAFALRFWSLRQQRKTKTSGTLDIDVREGGEGAGEVRAWVWWSLLGVAWVVATLSVLVTLDFIKDDAYISFRYAHNMVVGDGMTFNAGDKLEGFTNFLWVLVMVPFEALGMDLFQVCEVLGGILVLLMVWDVTRVHALVTGRGKWGSWLWPGMLLAASSNTALWATSGMEQPIAMWLPLAGAFVLWKGWHGGDERQQKWAIISGILLGLGCMARPEGHLIATLLGVPLLWEAIKKRKIDRFSWMWAASLLAVTAPYHLFRYVYFGTIVPNTYYVKTASSSLVWMTGLGKLQEMFDFNYLGWMVCLVPFAFISRRFLAEKLVMLAIVCGFMVHLVKVGVDEMHWHRLFLPALPFLLILTSLGMQHAAEAVMGAFENIGEKRRKWLRVQVYAVGWAAVIAATVSCFIFSYKEKAGFNGRGEINGMNHPDLGKFVTRHDRPHALVAFQDMGSTPYHAPDIDFLDFIGLVDRTVARKRHQYGLHPFMGTEAHHFQKQYDAEMRAYFYERNPEWTVLTTYIPKGDAARFGERFAKDPVPESLGPSIGQNSFQFGIWDDTFKSRYVHVRTWQHSTTYYLSLFRRKDLWEQIPKEVVLDEVPASMGGEPVKFERGLELLGWEIDKEVRAKQEIFVTTWWRVPGPMEPDIYFFVHANRPDFQAPFDHKPGDSMYPADRWKPGQIIEHRVVLPMPPGMIEGEYDLWFGVYRRSTGARFKVEAGPHDGSQRVPLGKVTVLPWRPLIDHIVAPPNSDKQRKYPDRIMDSGRRHD